MSSYYNPVDGTWIKGIVKDVTDPKDGTGTGVLIIRYDSVREIATKGDQKLAGFSVGTGVEFRRIKVGDYDWRAVLKDGGEEK